jgi:hypothetical protein
MGYNLFMKSFHSVSGLRPEHLLLKRKKKPKQIPFDYERRNKHLRVLGFTSYKEYLKSDIWFEIRNSVLQRDNSRCIICGKAASNVHHNSYELEVLAGAKLEFLVSLCRYHHEQIEFDDDNQKHDLQAARSSLAKKGTPVPALVYKNVSNWTKSQPHAPPKFDDVRPKTSTDKLLLQKKRAQIARQRLPLYIIEEKRALKEIKRRRKQKAKQNSVGVRQWRAMG